MSGVWRCVTSVYSRGPFSPEFAHIMKKSGRHTQQVVGLFFHIAEQT